jgi:hypothetical protein
MSRSAKGKKTEPARTPVKAMVVASHARALTKSEHATLAEALRRGATAHESIESAIVEFGRWLLIHVFDDDAGAALQGRRENLLWRELLARAGGPTLRLSPRALHLSITIAANDKRIQDESWRLLDVTRKQILLPLGDPTEMRRAAQHVISMKLSSCKTREYVRALVAARDQRGRRVSAPVLQARIKQFRERVSAPAFRKGAEIALRSLPSSDRGAVRGELEALRAWVDGLLAVVRRTK